MIKTLLAIVACAYIGLTNQAPTCRGVPNFVCPNNWTCCNGKDLLTCVKISNAICCSDGLRACPIGFTCERDGSCRRA